MSETAARRTYLGMAEISDYGYEAQGLATKGDYGSALTFTLYRNIAI